MQYFAQSSAFSISEISLSRSILIVWAVITIVVGAFIFGQSTTIAVMELLNKYWTPQPSGFTFTPGYYSVTLEESSFLAMFAQPELPRAKCTFCCVSIHLLQTKHKRGHQIFLCVMFIVEERNLNSRSWLLFNNPQGCVCSSHLFLNVFVLCETLKYRIKATFWLKYSVWLEQRQGAAFNRILLAFYIRSFYM